MSITETQWENVTSKFVTVDGNYTLLSVNKRLRKAVTNRENGKSGGRPPKPKKPSLETQNNPPSERERESEVESEREKKYNDEERVLPATFFTISNFENEVNIGENEFTMYAVRESNKTQEQLNKLKAKFIKDQRALGKVTWQDMFDAKKHFVNWCKKQSTTTSKMHY